MDELDLQILSASINNPEANNYFHNYLIADAVGKPTNTFGMYQLYTNAIKCFSETGEINPKVFKIWLSNYPDLYSELGGDKGYSELQEQLSSIEPIDYITLTRLGNKRLQKKVSMNKLEELNQLLQDDQSTDDQIQAATSELVDRIKEAKDREPIALRRSQDIAADIDGLWAKDNFIPTQFKKLNNLLGHSVDNGGVTRGNVYTIADMSGVGKSTFAKSLCVNWLDNGYKILFINFEEAQLHWETILFSQVVAQDIYRVKAEGDSAFCSSLEKKFRKTLDKWGSNFMVRHDPDSVQYDDLEDWLKDLYYNQESDRPDIVVIDTIQSLFKKGGNGTRWGQFEEIMVRLEQLAKEMNAVFLITAQQNNNSLIHSKEELDQSDIGGGVTIVQKSSVVMFLVPAKSKEDSGFGEEEQQTDLYNLRVIKNRITGKKSGQNPPIIRYDGDSKMFVDLNAKQASELINASYNPPSLEDIDPNFGV